MSSSFIVISLICARITVQDLIYDCSMENSCKSDWAGTSGCVYANQDGHCIWDPENSSGKNLCSDNGLPSTCIRLRNDWEIYSYSGVMSTVGYTDIYFYFDAFLDDQESNDYCCVYYRRSSSQSWQQAWCDRSSTDGEFLENNHYTYLGSSYGGYSSFAIKLAAEGDAGADNCYYSDIRVYGTPDTPEPTPAFPSIIFIQQTKDVCKQTHKI